MPCLWEPVLGAETPLGAAETPLGAPATRAWGWVWPLWFLGWWFRGPLGGVRAPGPCLGPWGLRNHPPTSCLSPSP